MSLKRFLTLSLIATSLTGFSECERAPDLDWHPKPFVTDSQTAGIVRQAYGEVETVSCADPAFNGRVCFTLDEMKEAQAAYARVVRACEKWK